MSLNSAGFILINLLAFADEINKKAALLNRFNQI